MKKSVIMLPGHRYRSVDANGSTKMARYIDEPKGKSSKYGGAVIRGQVAEPTDGHGHLVETIASHHNVIVIYLGYTGGVPTEEDPLTVDMRSAMLRERFPHLNMIILPIKDNPIAPKFWSVDLDTSIKNHVPAGRGIILYDGRDGFSKVYEGKHPVVQIDTLPVPSGTESRAKTVFPHSIAGRKALIAFHQKRPGFGYSTVDVAIFDFKNDELIMGSRDEFGDYRCFCGGHWEKCDETLEDTAGRERGEEILGIKTTPVLQLRSMPVPDPRYRRSKKDGTVTTLFACRYISGKPRHGDDLDSVWRVKRTDLMNCIVPHHKKLAEYILANWDDIKAKLNK